jgi:hypothetical protein
LRVRHAEQLQEEDFHKEIARDEVIQRITINLGDESDDSELSDTEGEEDDDNVSYWLFHYCNCVVLIYQDTGNNYHRFENKNKVTLHMFILNFLLNVTCSQYRYSIFVCANTGLTSPLSPPSKYLATLPFTVIGLSPRAFKYYVSYGTQYIIMLKVAKYINYQLTNLITRFILKICCHTC